MRGRRKALCISYMYRGGSKQRSFIEQGHRSADASLLMQTLACETIVMKMKKVPNPQIILLVRACCC